MKIPSYRNWTSQHNSIFRGQYGDPDKCLYSLVISNIADFSRCILVDMTTASVVYTDTVSVKEDTDLKSWYDHCRDVVARLCSLVEISVDLEKDADETDPNLSVSFLKKYHEKYGNHGMAPLHHCTKCGCVIDPHRVGAFSKVGVDGKVYDIYPRQCPSCGVIFSYIVELEQVE